MKLLTLFFISSLSFSAVWNATNTWNQSWESKYKEWMRSSLDSRIFTKGKYKGIKTDCADAVYSTRAIFSFENSLPFVITNTLGGSYKTLSNKTRSFDHISDPTKRFMAFINNLGNIVSTISLAHYDTFPVKIDAIAPGDTYVTVNPNNSRHAYMVKEILETGFFHMMYSNVPRGVRELTERFGYPVPLFKKAPFGFKRFKWPKYMANSNLEIPSSLGFGNDQYIMRDRYPNEPRFFEALTERLREKSETIKEEIDRVLKNAKIQLKFRAKVVKEAIEYKKEIGGRCMNYSEYDSYSTPSRDGRIINEISTLKTSWRKAKEDGITFTIDDKYRLAMDYLIGDDRTEEAGKELASLLKIKFRRGIFKRPRKTNIKDFYFGVLSGKVSSNPNDSLLRRWGFEDNSPRQNCSEFKVRNLEIASDFPSNTIKLEEIIKISTPLNITYLLKKTVTPKGTPENILFKLDNYGFPIELSLTNRMKFSATTADFEKMLNGVKTSTVIRNQLDINGEYFYQEIENGTEKLRIPYKK